MRATTDAAEAVAGASYAVHAVPVQHSRAFLAGIRDVLAKDVPIICVSKGLEVGSGAMMSEVIPSALGRRQPAVFLSGPSFAKEVGRGVSPVQLQRSGCWQRAGHSCCAARLAVAQRAWCERVCQQGQRSLSCPGALASHCPPPSQNTPASPSQVMQGRPTGVVAACKDMHLGRQVQELFASPSMRVNTSTDVTGVEICGALKNVLAIAAGIVEGLDLGHNALAALIAQGCAEIRWLSQKVGAKPATIAGLSGLGDIMLTCYGDLSRNRSVGIRLGRGERLEDILASSSQVAEGVATAGVVVTLARRYRVSLPVLTAVAQVLDNNLTPAQAVTAVMNLPQIEER